MSRSRRATLATAVIMAVAVLAGCTQQATQKAAIAGAASPGTPAVHPSAATSATPTTPAPSDPPARPSPSGTRYTNARFGFSFTVPVGYRAQSPPADGDGLSFASPARVATVTAYGAGNAGRCSPAQELAQLVRTYQSARDTITYRFFHNDVIALSGTTPGGAVFYQREIVYPAVIYTLLWNYPAATKARYDILVTQTVDSFVPGPDHSG